MHLDCVGGIAGDMFVAAMLDAFPDLGPHVAGLATSLPLPDSLTVDVIAHNDGVLAGVRFDVSDATPDHHAHRRAAEIQEWITANVADQEIATAAKGIFAVLAEAEAEVHGIAAADVAFHEVGAWDSIVDIVAAAAVIVRSAADSWSVGAVPVGSGRVRSQHGDLPVPAPAVVNLLRGFAVFDDGRPGERVTPTGAAILRFLSPGFGAPKAPHRQHRVGVGFGTKTFDGLSNIVRVRELLPITVSEARKDSNDSVGVLEFEIDDQSSEDLAIGLDHLRADNGVLDVVQYPAFGKKNRMYTCVRVLVDPSAVGETVDRIFCETTTLGVRTSIVARRVLSRTMRSIDDVGVKVVDRPNGESAKAEIDDVAELRSFAERATKRRDRERRAVVGPGEEATQ